MQPLEWNDFRNTDYEDERVFQHDGQLRSTSCAPKVDLDLPNSSSRDSQLLESGDRGLQTSKSNQKQIGQWWRQIRRTPSFHAHNCWHVLCQSEICEQDGQLRSTLGVGGARFGELLLSSRTTPGIIEQFTSILCGQQWHRDFCCKGLIEFLANKAVDLETLSEDNCDTKASQRET